MRADRLISILLLLQMRKKLTTRELAQELEVTERTIHRDMDALSSAGIPVVAERGKAGGWKLLNQYRTNLTGLKANEIKSLLLSPSLQLLTDLGLASEWYEARQKILASTSDNFQKYAEDIWNRIHIDTTAWRQSPEKVESFKVLQEAIWEERILQIEYERADGECVNRIVYPLGLVAKGSTWYLIALSKDKIKNFRASRMKSALLIDETFSRPSDFNLAQYWSNSTHEFIKNLPKFEVQVEVSPSILHRIKFTGRFVQILKMDPPLDNGWTPLKLCFETEQEAKEYILGFNNQIRIIQPDTLKDTVYEMALDLIDFYEQGNQS
jgi:predicted DNA-binding transcriptional regulator YafY